MPQNLLFNQTARVRAIDCGQQLPRQRNDHRLTVLAALLAGLTVAASAASAASDVVISQVYGGGGNSGAVYKNDFIELFNRGANAVSMNGWSVQYASATGTSWQVTTLPNLTLQAGQYLLVQEAAGSAGSANLPTPDKLGTIAMSGTTGKVALVNSITAITSASSPAVLDLIGFGPTATAFEGSAPAALSSNTNALLRANDGCTDENQNATDFSALVAAPRNSASPLHVCGAASNTAIVTNCPASLMLAANVGGSINLSASDLDGQVNAITLANGSLAAFSLAGLVPATTVGAIASVNLNVANTLGLGSYPVVINFANDQGQTATCTVSVVVQAASGITHTIPQIQGSAASSPYVGSTQTTEGVVTLRMPNGFYMQDPQGDGDPTTSDGIFVFTSTAPAVAVGDKLRVTAKVQEFVAGDAKRTITQLTAPSAIITLSSGNSLTPTNISLPLASVDEWERYEGMLVRFVRPLVVSQNYFLGRYGQLSLSGTRLEKPTNRYPARSPEAQAAAAANLANLIVLDDASSAQNPNPAPYLGADNTIRAGDTVSDLVGVVDFGLITSANPGPTGYKLQPLGAPVFSRDNARSNAPEILSGNLKVASFNVLNFFSTFTNGATVDGQTGQGCKLGTSIAASNCRGADNLNEFNRQRAKIVAAMKAIDADVFGLMEVQNNGNIALSHLVNGLNAEIGSAAYAYVPVTASTGSDAIRVAMIYKTEKLKLVGAALTDADAINNRPPLAQTFALANGKRFSVIVNHMKSKGSCPSDGSLNQDQADGQGCWNALRVQQAERLANSFIPQVQAAANDNDVLVIGDLNSYGAEDPILSLQNAGLVSEIERFIRPHSAPYSYVFDGESGYIDHALTSKSLSEKVIGVAEWHINADEPLLIDYNTEFKVQDLYTATPFRSSDHDPVVIALNLQPQFVDVSAQITSLSSGLSFNRSTQSFNGTLTITNSGGAILKGPFQVELNSLTAGVTLLNASGDHNGSAYLSSAINSLAPGQSISLPLVFRNPNKVGITYQTSVFSGNF
ncbi:ExeM/NucH family extracellular endonuclease [Undibacterium sp.]|uniref:ExeM/NucH family extracellular endonuclease n=1 Tax=Undibacterium sp. TaxID=1914977 RepID=UPI0025FAAEA4|nr:ExeM/NucH family extracellular endonuclease [Undibacterium sp.]